MIKQLKKGLFNTPNERVSAGASPNDVNIIYKDDEYPDDYKLYLQEQARLELDSFIEDLKDIVEWAITINISPHKLMNKKRWWTYTHQEQQEVLFRMERASTKGTPVNCVKAVFEVCPKLKQVHMHALYEMPRRMGYEKVIKEWWDDRVSTTDKNTIIPFRHFDCREIYDRAGWEKYIMKDQ